MFRKAIVFALVLSAFVSAQCFTSGGHFVQQRVVRPQKVVKQQVVKQQVVKPARKVVRQQVYEPAQIVEEQVVVEGDNSEVLFFVSPEFRRNQLYPDRQEQTVNSELLRAVQDLRELIIGIQAQQPVQQNRQSSANNGQAARWQNTPPPQPERLDTISAVRANCTVGLDGAACHSGPNPARGFSLDGNLAVSDTWFRRSLEQIVTGDMPADRELDQMTKNKILIELLSRKP